MDGSERESVVVKAERAAAERKERRGRGLLREGGVEHEENLERR